jgi:hypothetical protein
LLIDNFNPLKICENGRGCIFPRAIIYAIW